MIWYCMVASFVGGFLFTLPFLLDFHKPDRVDISQALVLALFFGGGTALHQRLLASILIGAAMAIVTGKFPQATAYPWPYKFVMGLTTAAIVHLFAPVQLARFHLSELTDGAYDKRLEMAAASAIYAGAIYLSQVMAGMYIRETTS